MISLARTALVSLLSGAAWLGPLTLADRRGMAWLWLYIFTLPACHLAWAKIDRSYR